MDGVCLSCVHAKSAGARAENLREKVAAAERGFEQEIRNSTCVIPAEAISGHATRGHVDADASV